MSGVDEKNRCLRVYRLAMFDPVDDGQALEFFGPRFTRDEAVSRQLRRLIDKHNAILCKDRDVSLLFGVFEEGK